MGLYLRALGKFVSGREAALLEQALAGRDPIGARRAAHTLKGVAATLGAQALRHQAAALEQSLIQAGPQADLSAFAADAADLDLAFQRLAGELAAVLPLPEALPPLDAGAVDASALEAATSRLRQLLETDDMDCAQVYRDHEALLAQALGPAARKLSLQIDDFAFEEALATLNGALASLGGTPA
jgi:two-component system sensor histidine kinase/response regulator